MSACDRCLVTSAGTVRRGRVPRASDRPVTADLPAVRGACTEHGVSALCSCDPGYPAALQQLPDPPPVLYVRGNVAVLARCPDEAIGIVGTRRPTMVGRDAARRIGAGLARSGGIVVSGMALGVDAAAHEGALSVREPTVAVLAGGPERATPAAHRRLYDRILECGAVVSELPPGTAPAKWTFPARNRIIAALSCATVVVEAPRRSGALITVEHALDLGRDVYAVPGSLASDTCEGSNRLLCEGSGAVTDGAALAARLGMSRMNIGGGPADGPLGLLRAALVSAPRTSDELAARLPGLAPDEIELGLLDLELGGWIERCPGGRYRTLEAG